MNASRKSCRGWVRASAGWVEQERRALRDCQLSKLFFDRQDSARATEYRANRAPVLARYELKPEVRAAVDADDVAFLAQRVDPCLLRFYFLAASQHGGR